MAEPAKKGIGYFELVDPAAQETVASEISGALRKKYGIEANIPLFGDQDDALGALVAEQLSYDLMKQKAEAAIIANQGQAKGKVLIEGIYKAVDERLAELAGGKIR